MTVQINNLFVQPAYCATGHLSSYKSPRRCVRSSEFIKMVLSMDRWIGKAAIVTGVSSGLGKAIAEDLVKTGLKVVGVARRVELVQKHAEELAGERGKLYPYQADMTNEKEILKLIEWTKTNVGPIHILINNAGWGYVGSLIEGDEEETLKWRKIFDLNVLGLSIATREAVKNMRENGIAGHIIHINSIAGHYIPNNGLTVNVYPASKFAVTALAETLRLELATLESKIRITNLSPGAVKSELADQVIGNFTMAKAEDIADAVHYILSTPEHLQIQELVIRPVGDKF